MRQRQITDFFAINHGNEDPGLIPNMATAPCHPIRYPSLFDGKNELEKFIEEFNRYARLTGMADDRKKIMVTAFLAPEIIQKYEGAQGKTCEEKLRNAFKKKKSILDHMAELVNLRLGESDPEEIFKIADNLITIITNKKINKEDLSNLVYKNMIDDFEIKKELVLRGTSKKEDVKDIVQRMHKLKTMEETGPIAMYKTQKTGTKDNHQEFKWRTVSNRRKQERYTDRDTQKMETRRQPTSRADVFDNRTKEDTISFRCYGCNKVGHIRRNCPDRRSNMRCHACQELGHIRRECPNVRCTYCQTPGHRRSQCYKNKDRFIDRRERAEDQRSYRRPPMAEITEIDNENERTRNITEMVEENDEDNDRKQWTGNVIARPRREVINVLN